MLPVTIAGRELTEFNAKMQSYPEIGSCEVDAGVFQGADRSSLHLLHNRRGMRTLTCMIDFFGKDNYERTYNQSCFEALFLSNEPVILDICDGFWYSAVLAEIGRPVTDHELITTVTYAFRVTRHRGDQITAKVIPDNAKLWCQSNVTKTDCVICLPASNFGGAKSITVSLNGLWWSFSSADGVSGDLIFDGINKLFTMDGETINNQVLWTDFPYLIPGENIISVGIDVWNADNKEIHVSYTPTFL